MKSLAARIFAAIAIANLIVTIGVSFVIGADAERMRAEHDAMVVDVLRAEGSLALSAAQTGDADETRTIERGIASRTGMPVVVLRGDQIVAAHTLDAGDERSIRAAIAVSRTRAEGWAADGEWIALAPRGDDGVALRRPHPPSGFFGLSPPGLHFALVLLLAAAVSFGLARWLSRPIRALRAAAHKVIEGDLTVRVAPSIERGADSEVAALADDFDRMTSRVETLLASRERLLRDVSHELRSPLARLSLALDVARQNAPPESTEALDRIARESERLEELIALVLTMARLDNASAVDLRERLRLDDIVREVRGDATYEAERTGRRVETVALDEAMIEGNAELLRQAIENVVRNALRFGPEGTAIELGLEVRPGEVVFSVRDHGPGVPAEHLEDIFRPFTRLSTAREHDSGGAGVGLAIADRAIRLHGGRVWAELPRSGGLCVTLSIPRP